MKLHRGQEVVARTIFMRWPGVVVSAQVHAFLLGYLSGQLGLVMMPLTLFTVWSQPAAKNTSLIQHRLIHDPKAEESSASIALSFDTRQWQHIKLKATLITQHQVKNREKRAIISRRQTLEVKYLLYSRVCSHAAQNHSCTDSCSSQRCLHTRVDSHHSP